MTQGLKAVVKNGRRKNIAHGTISILANTASALSDFNHIDDNTIDIKNALSEAGFETVTFINPNESLPPTTLSPLSQSDLGLVDLRGCVLTPATISALKSCVATAPFTIVFLVDQTISAGNLNALATVAEIIAEDDLISADPANLFLDLLRIRMLTASFRRRVDVYDRLLSLNNKRSRRSLFLDPIDKPTPLAHVLVAGEPDPIVLSLINEIEANGGKAQCVYRPGQAIRALETGEFNAAVFLPRENGDPLNALARAIRRHQRFFTMPILNILQQDLSVKTSLRPGRQLTGDQICAKLYPILSSGLHRAQFYGELVSQTDRLMKSEQAFARKNPKLFTSTHLQSLLDQADAANQPNTFVIIKAGFGTLEKSAVHDLMLTMRKRIMKSIRKADFVMPLSIKDNAIIHAVCVGQQSRNDLIRVAGRLESLLRSSAICAPQSNPLTMDISTQIFTRAAGLRLEETVAGMVQGLSKGS